MNNFPEPLEFKNLDKPQSWAAKYFAFNISRYDHLLKTKGENFWSALGQKKSLQLFHAAAELVPAYKDFLKKNKIDHKKIVTPRSFSQVPETNKQNYIQPYGIKDRCWNGDLSKSSFTAVSSGTTGQPQFWPRNGFQEIEAAVTHELIYKNSFQIDKYKTLMVIGFPMGVYVSGMATALPSWLVAQKGYPLTVVSAGNNKSEVLKAVKQLQGDFQQVVLVGHPFFIKDCIETGKAEGIKWGEKRLRMMLCSEGFSETWRDYLAKEAGIGDRTGIISTYGSSEMLLMAYETPMSIKLKQLLETDKWQGRSLKHNGTTTNIFQYNPALRYIENANHELIFTSASGTPLIRFNLHDSGTTISFAEAGAGVKTHFKDTWQLPFVALYGRSDYTVIFYAANIYPQHIHAALSHKDFFPKITGKFSLRKGYLKNMDEFLEINVELRPKVIAGKNLQKQLQKQIFEGLLRLNMEFHDASKRFPHKTTPKVVTWPYQHEKFFKPGLKPKYILQ